MMVEEWMNGEKEHFVELICCGMHPVDNPMGYNFFSWLRAFSAYIGIRGVFNGFESNVYTYIYIEYKGLLLLLQPKSLQWILHF